MTTNTGTTTTEAPAYTADSKAVRALVQAIGTIGENITSNATVAFRNVCSEAGEHTSAVMDIYTPLNDAHRAGKVNATDVSFKRFYDSVVTACSLLKVKAPDQRLTRQMFLFATRGADVGTQQLFLKVAAVTGEYSVRFDEYVRFLGNRADYTDAGNLTAKAKQARKSAAAKREADAAVATAAKTARPLAFDFDTLATSQGVNAESTADLVKFLMLMQQDLAVAIASKVKTLTDDDRTKVIGSVESAILAHAS